MKVFVHGPYNRVTRIEFCCDEMAEDILLGRVKTRPWTDHPLGFWVTDCAGDDYRLSHCGHCGAKIEGECFNNLASTQRKLNIEREEYIPMERDEYDVPF